MHVHSYKLYFSTKGAIRVSGGRQAYTMPHIHNVIVLRGSGDDVFKLRRIIFSRHDNGVQVCTDLFDRKTGTVFNVLHVKENDLL